MRSLTGPIAQARLHGGLVNPWVIAGLKRDEVRNSATLAGLWNREFGGSASTRFLAAYLGSAIPSVDWHGELLHHYRVETEINPLGCSADRVDLIIETCSHLIGIEIKIDAGLGFEQLERYRTSVGKRAKLMGLTGHVIFLSGFHSEEPNIYNSSWRDVERAAFQATASQKGSQTFVETLIGHFGRHVRTF